MEFNIVCYKSQKLILCYPDELDNLFDDFWTFPAILIMYMFKAVSRYKFIVSMFDLIIWKRKVEHIQNT
jgi:hypothetical protein